MDLGINGKRALVCASSKGLGLGCAQALAAAGVDLVMNARGVEALEASAQAIRDAHGVEVATLAADVTTQQGQNSLLEAAGQVDILVTNAGGPPPGLWSDWDRDDFIRALDANMLTPIALMKALLPEMSARGQHHQPVCQSPDRRSGSFECGAYRPDGICRGNGPASGRYGCDD
jgi:3-oxoacyl-[acyl-carrier protein] reductase